jgi:hypothetical protein
LEEGFKMSKYDAKYICGYCKKTTSLDDEVFEKLIENKDEINFFTCSCGHYSYESRLRAKIYVQHHFWKGVYGSTEEAK